MTLSLEELKAWSESLKDSKNGRKKFSQEFKSSVVEFGSSNSIAVSKLCLEVGINANQFYLWKKSIKAEGGKFTEVEARVKAEPVAEVLAPEPSLRIVSPDGFSLEGDFSSICKAWEALHASASR